MAATNNALALAAEFARSEHPDRDRLAALVAALEERRRRLSELEERRREVKAEAVVLNAEVEAIYAEMRDLLPRTPGPRIG